MPYVKKAHAVKARDFSRAGEASIDVQAALKAVGFDPALIRRVAICAYEAEMNVVLHGGDGELVLSIDPQNIRLEITDRGPGIADIELAMQEGYSTAPPEYREMGFGAGMGLPNCKKNSDFFRLYSEKGKGTRLEMGFRVV
jgi:anti-sigma regulatory factor (Ser/Thr protein kinase)